MFCSASNAFAIFLLLRTCHCRDVVGAASFQQLGERALLFAGLGKVRDPASVFRQDQLDETTLRSKLRPNQSHVLIATSNRQLMTSLLDEVESLESFFPGLKRLCALFPCYSCRQVRRLLLQRREQQMQAEGVSHHAAEAAGAQALMKAEAADREELRYLEAAGEPDHFDVSSFFILHKEALEEAWQRVPKLHELLPVQVEDHIYLCMENAVMYDVFNHGREYPTPRFFAEVLTLFKQLLSALKEDKPAADDSSDEHTDANPLPGAANAPTSAAAADAMQRKADRQFAIAVSQIVELPTYASIRQYCAKHMNELRVAFSLCPRLEELCGPLPEIARADTQIRCDAPLSRLNREDCVPEYMHALRCAVKVMSNYAELLTSDFTMSQAEQEEYRLLLENHAYEVAAMRLLQSSKWTLDEDWMGVARIYGEDSSQYLHQHFHFLRELFQTVSLSAAIESIGKEQQWQQEHKWLSFIEAEWNAGAGAGGFVYPQSLTSVNQIVGEHLVKCKIWTENRSFDSSYYEYYGIERTMEFKVCMRLGMVLDKEINAAVDAAMAPTLAAMREEILRLEPDIDFDALPGVNKMHEALIRCERKYERWLPIVGVMCTKEHDVFSNLKGGDSSVDTSAENMLQALAELPGTSPGDLESLWRKLFARRSNADRDGAVFSNTKKPMPQLEAAARLYTLLMLVHGVQAAAASPEVEQLIERVCSFRLLGMAAPAEVAAGYAGNWTDAHNAQADGGAYGVDGAELYARVGGPAAVRQPVAVKGRGAVLVHPLRSAAGAAVSRDEALDKGRQPHPAGPRRQLAAAERALGETSAVGGAVPDTGHGECKRGGLRLQDAPGAEHRADVRLARPRPLQDDPRVRLLVCGCRSCEGVLVLGVLPNDRVRQSWRRHHAAAGAGERADD